MTSIQNVSKILAIRLSGIGDVILMMPALAALKSAFRDPQLTLVTGSQCAPIARMCPSIDQVLSIDREALKNKPKLTAIREIYRLIRNVRAEGFDLVVDFHSLRETNLMTRLSGAPYRAGLNRSGRAYLSFCFNLDPVVQDDRLHMADTFRAVAENVPGVGPIVDTRVHTIEVPPEAKSMAAARRGPGPLVVLNVGASRAPRRWAASRFSAVASHAIQKWGASVLILGGTSEAEARVARKVQALAESPERIDVLFGLTFAELVAVIDVADLLVSNDSGPMHVGPALGVPTIGIFAGGSPQHYRPVGPVDLIVEGASMDQIEVDTVVSAMDEIWTRLEFNETQPGA